MPLAFCVDEMPLLLPPAGSAVWNMCVDIHSVKSGLFAQCRQQDEIHRGSVLKFETEYGILEESRTRGFNEMGNLRGEGSSSAAPAVLFVISSTCFCVSFLQAGVANAADNLSARASLFGM